MKAIRRRVLVIATVALAWLTSCGPGEPVDPATLPLPDIVATNAFYYYDDLDTAWQFYTANLGFETVTDYGFAKILRVADSAYLTLVNAADGMHTSAEPKTITLTLFTDELAGWHTHFGSKGIVTRVSFDPRRDKTPASFAIEDPEGYLIRFEAPYREESGGSIQATLSAEPVESMHKLDSAALTVTAALYALYMQSIETTLPFYRDMLGSAPTSNTEWAAVFKVTDSSFVGLVKGGDDLVSPTEENGVTLSFFTSDVDGWFERATNIVGFQLRTDEIFDESGMVRVFVGYDPEGYFLEWDTFAERPDNRVLLRYLRR